MTIYLVVRQLRDCRGGHISVVLHFVSEIAMFVVCLTTLVVVLYDFVQKSAVSAAVTRQTVVVAHLLLQSSVCASCMPLF